MADEYDLKIVNGDLDFGPDGEPVYLTGAAAIAQDVKHRLTDKATAVALIGDDEGGLTAVSAIKAEVEEDERIEPGTVVVTNNGDGSFDLTAKTLTGEPVNVSVGA